LSGLRDFAYESARFGVEASSVTDGTWVGKVVLGKYEIVDRIAEGNQSYVYWAKNLEGGGDAAVKIMKEDAKGDPLARDRMNREGSVLEMLSGSPACPRLYGRYWTDDGLLVLVLELLDGMDLQAMLDRDSRLLDPSEIVGLFPPVIATLSEAHKLGIIHRDIKPGNLFRTWDPPGLKLLDFGFARFTHLRSPGEAGRVSGSPKYIAPEAWLGKEDLDARADVYSMAVVLFRCLAGRCPFEHESLVQMLKVVPTAPRPALLSYRPDLPPALDDWATIALAADRDERFDNIQAMWDAFVRAARPVAERSALAGEHPDTPSSSDRGA